MFQHTKAMIKIHHLAGLNIGIENINIPFQITSKLCAHTFTPSLYNASLNALKTTNAIKYNMIKYLFTL